MTRLELSAAAETDLDEILTYSTIRFGDSVATEYYFGFQDSFNLLVRHLRVRAEKRKRRARAFDVSRIADIESSTKPMTTLFACFAFSTIRWMWTETY